MANSKIYVAGHLGMVGSAIMRVLNKKSDINLITRTRSELDLTNQLDVQNFFKREKPDQVYIAAARVGGIYANAFYPAEFIYENLMIEANIIHAAFLNDVKKILFLGSSCIYPKYATQPMKEDSLLTGSLEPTNEPYAIAKIAGIKICESYNRQYSKSHGIDYRSVMPTNMYGPGDNYHPKNSHVIPALIRRFHEAKVNKKENVIVWGTGKPMREFLYVDDMARACVHTMDLSEGIYKKHIKPMCSHINIGSGNDLTIEELAKTTQEIIGYKGKIKFDANKPDGSPRKFMDSQLINRLGWKPEVDLKEGLLRVYLDFKKSL
ncbi:GDP-L-fucose synthase [Candidatus Pelagibacter ubique]|nr:GDP-L-fucose synthase [Candidatus Pelagibacter ubique]